ncbi:MAG TPA: ATPase, T2SS/T4P/T4SS family [Candidatus Nitrosocosmicus sp.]|uniref:PINc/VapC family ATPase n=1 Tax=Candidatus Nitrosocosmicus agrestis TaxID=2563600 RepID=UPI00122E0B62|nr:ATPase, T2SS/T4P/T4SS family [Candidatus Nitrosocosmicus sp. SS]KAA2279865.1 PIN domain-containing protein [Candidatus Nitrosocosmicus sp. SS]KAF0870393.1 PIN domain-containing protein [Candidatus Nitrosocosmicus sp. SS]HET6590639.1 ATPase, T2SS/T4P/T4SS family [Candidatus Nitrosocosmicus sp.]
MPKKIVLDTSILIDGLISKKILENQFDDSYEIIIPRVAIDELQSQACKHREHGFVGLEELRKIRELSNPKNILIKIHGEMPSVEDIRLAKNGRIDALIFDLAKKEGAALYTADYIQHITALASGVESVHNRTIYSDTYNIENYFDNDSMSVHLIEGVKPLAKKGMPGNFSLVPISDKKLDKFTLNEIINYLFSAYDKQKVSNIEISFEGCYVLMYKNLRIVITTPPVSNKIEITAARPIKRLTIEDYHLDKNLVQRLSKDAEGILIAGRPGSGKSTFASSIAEHYVQNGKLVKTLESPRDLQVPESVIQYGSFKNSYEKVADLLLLVRPDFTIFDEVRRIKDFELFADLRLTGIGMIGVIHANEALDAIQRFIGKIELGMIPHVIDTVIFINGGKIDKIYELNLTVKVPSGMIEQDLSRPVVEIRDFYSKEVEYEIYSYGEENIIIPLKNIESKPGSEKNNKINKLAESKIREVIARFDPQAEIKIISSNKIKVAVAKEKIPKIIGRGGSTISEIEKILGVKIDVESKVPSIGNEIPFRITESGSRIYLLVDESYIGKKVNLFLNDESLVSNQIGKRSKLKIDKKSEVGRKVFNSIMSNNQDSIKLYESLEP